MGNLAVRAQGLGKRYRLGQAKRTDRGSGSTGDEFWALKDVSFDIEHGEVVGIIGNNGAGKSTLLKVLSRITEPTEGYADIHGRVGSLLEVGTGFHPDLTGRENIYLNGAILGMKRAEIRRKLDEIIAFAEIEKFIDTPVKRYSSGMYVRLAFAVAANLQPEILIIDEVLAVGDAAFQKKCLGKMGEAAGSGRTVLFVSHNMGAIQQLCSRVLLFRSGSLSGQGTPETMIAEYLNNTVPSNNGDFDFSQHPARAANFQPIIQRVTLRAADGSPTTQYYPDDSLRIELTLNPAQPIRDPRFAIAIEDSLGRRITTLLSHFGGYQMPDLEAYCRISCTIPRLCLGSDQYLISVSMGTQYGGLLDSVDGGAWFDVGWRNNYENGEPYHTTYGPVLVPSVWQQPVLVPSVWQ